MEITKCMYCGREIPTLGEFCPHCGKKQTIIYTRIFTRNSYGEKSLLEEINQWLFSHPEFANITMQINTETHPGILTVQPVLNDICFSYEVLPGDSKYVYQVEPYKWFGLYQKDSKAVLQRWQQQHPGAIVVSAPAITVQRRHKGSLALHGIGANNEVKIYIFYKRERVASTKNDLSASEPSAVEPAPVKRTAVDAFFPLLPMSEKEYAHAIEHHSQTGEWPNVPKGSAKALAFIRCALFYEKHEKYASYQEMLAQYQLFTTAYLLTTHEQASSLSGRAQEVSRSVLELLVIYGEILQHNQTELGSHLLDEVDSALISGARQ